MATVPETPAWHVVEPPRASTLDVPDGWAYHGIAALERAVALADLGHDDLAPGAVDLLVEDRHQEHERSHRLVAVTDRGPGEPSSVVGHGVLALPVNDNRHLALAHVAVLPEHRRHGVGAALADRLRRVALTEGRTTALVEVDFAAEPPADAPGTLEPREGDGRVSVDLPGVRFARRAGLELEIVTRRSVLDLPLPDGVVEGVVARAAARAGPAYRVRTWHDEVPEPWLAPYAVLEQRLTQDEPNGGLALEPERWDADRVRTEEGKLAERARKTLITVAEHVPTGTLAGMTVLVHAEDRPDLTEQESTVVLPEHRGRRLGMLVKAVNLREHARRFPQVRRVSTWNNETNAPMLAVNVALGFRPAGGSAEMQASLARLRLLRR